MWKQLFALCGTTHGTCDLFLAIRLCLGHIGETLVANVLVMYLTEMGFAALGQIRQRHKVQVLYKCYLYVNFSQTLSNMISNYLCKSSK